MSTYGGQGDHSELMVPHDDGSYSVGTYGGQGDYAELMAIHDELDRHTEAMRRAGCQLAENNRKYREAIRVQTLIEQDKKTPVTVTSDIVRGTPSIAQLKCNVDCADAIYKTEQEVINVLKLKIRTIQAQIEREWSQASRY